MQTIDFAGRAVVVTGGTRGIGAGIARAFLDAGADVLVCGRSEPAGRSGPRGAAAPCAPALTSGTRPRPTG